MHGSAVTALRGGALLILGVSGAGKSTTAAELVAGGRELITDDACAIDSDGLIWPGAPLLRAASRDGSWQSRGTFEGKPAQELPKAVDTPLHPAAVVALERCVGGDLSVRSMRPAEALVSILSHVRAPWLLTERRRQLQLSTAASLARGPVARVEYDPRRHDPASVAEAVGHWEAAP